MKKRIILLAIACAMVFSGCGPFASRRSHNNEGEYTPVVNTETGIVGKLELEPNEYSTWITYWDSERSFQEIDAADNFSEISVFEALYDASYNILLPGNTEELVEQVKQTYPQKDIYLSFVNDIETAEQTYSHKDTDFLKAVLKNDDTIDKYTSDIVAVAENHGVDGIELDYENMRKVKETYEPYSRFVEALYEKAVEKGLKLRVDVEYQVAVNTSLPKELKYVVMCYDLKGYGTEPGPKANPDFIRECCKNYGSLPNVVMAFSTGGFDWVDGKVSAAITELQAKELATEFGATIEHDNDGSAHFTYKDQGKKHTVYFADTETLNTWIDTANEMGYNQIAIWRTGGNEISTIKDITK